LRCSKSPVALIPNLSLKVLSMGDFAEALD
jgi:hypothetical protein